MAPNEHLQRRPTTLLRTRTESVYRRTALDIGRRLVTDAVPTRTGVTWHGDDLAGADEATMRVVHGPVGLSVYSGNAGIGWFLGRLAAYEADGAMAKTALHALEHAVSNAADPAESVSQALLTGTTGIAYAALDIATLFGDGTLHRNALALARRCADDVRSGRVTEETDFMSGLAGTAIGLLAIDRIASDSSFVDAAAVACGHLIDGAGSLGWTAWAANAERLAPPLCGLAHGASGIAWALDEFARRCDDARARDVARNVFRYERARFSAERCAWPDLRKTPSTGTADSWPAWTTAWCHGGIGIAAVRLHRYEQTQDAPTLAEATAGIHAARMLVAAVGDLTRAGHAPDVTLCHGLGGAADLMLLAHEVTAVPDHWRAARRVGDLCLDVHRANGNRWTNGLRGAQNVPGLFAGSAGIGAMMLRLHDSHTMTSPLLIGMRRQNDRPTA